MKSIWILLLLTILSLGCITEDASVKTNETVETTSLPVETTITPRMIVPLPTLPTTTGPSPTTESLIKEPVETTTAPQTTVPPTTSPPTTIPSTTEPINETPVETPEAPQTTVPPTSEPPPPPPPPTTTPPPSTPSTTFTGMVADCQYPYGTLNGISNTTISYEGTSNITDEGGQFFLTLTTQDTDPLLEITSPGYVSYSERPSRMVEGAFHLIPDSLFQSLYSLLWDNSGNPQNWHRKWGQQTEFVIVQTDASQQQLDDVQTILATDEYRKMTGSRFTSAVQKTIVDSKPTGSNKDGKTVISFESGITDGGIAYSEDSNGVINYAEITWDVNQSIDTSVLWHNMVHTVTAGGHISEWSSVVGVSGGVGSVTENDEKILNCIYNSPPKRTEPST